MSERQRMGESTRSREAGEERSLGQRILGGAFVLASLALGVLAVCAVWFLLVELPELIELAESGIRSADALARAIEQHGGVV